MKLSTFIIVLLVDILLAYLIANYQRANGYSFWKSFIGAFIGLIGLSLLALKAFS